MRRIPETAACRLSNRFPIPIHCHLPSSIFPLSLVLLLGTIPAAVCPADEFSVGGLAMELQEVTTNLDVYYSAMRWNRVSNEWDADVILSNKSTITITAPLVLLVQGFSGTTGTLRPDGVSTNHLYYDFTGMLPTGMLAPGQRSTPRTLGIANLAGQAPHLQTRLFAGSNNNSIAALGYSRSLDQAGLPVPSVGVAESGPDKAANRKTDPILGVVTLGQAPGSYSWEFTMDGYLPVWREAQLSSNHVT
ncbi:MAG: hypothetical protein ACREIC_18515, partial [Limisphaerales bacterium]